MARREWKRPRTYRVGTLSAFSDADEDGTGYDCSRRSCGELVVSRDELEGTPCPECTRIAALVEQQQQHWDGVTPDADGRKWQWTSTIRAR